MLIDFTIVLISITTFAFLWAWHKIGGERLFLWNIHFELTRSYNMTLEALCLLVKKSKKNTSNLKNAPNLRPKTIAVHAGHPFRSSSRVEKWLWCGDLMYYRLHNPPYMANMATIIMHTSTSSYHTIKLWAIVRLAYFSTGNMSEMGDVTDERQLYSLNQAFSQPFPSSILPRSFLDPSSIPYAWRSSVLQREAQGII